MAGSFIAGTAIFERGKGQLDRDHLGGDLVDALTVPHGRRVRRVELGAKVLVLAVQLVQLHGWAPRETKNRAAGYRQGACRRDGARASRPRPTDAGSATR